MTTTIFANIISETEKAYQVEVLYKFLRDGSEKTWKAWVPKSQVTFEKKEQSFSWLTLPVWLAKKIDTEIANLQRQPKMNDVDFLVHA